MTLIEEQRGMQLTKDLLEFLACTPYSKDEIKVVLLSLGIWFMRAREATTQDVVERCLPEVIEALKDVAQRLAQTRAVRGQGDGYGHA